ncbi:MAG: hypothetical protein DME57_01395 [Verrucomicrobia bacterium]|nr:MAG: hypothetical protein DME57_01395 [Verrucomicrobiota bacterium]
MKTKSIATIATLVLLPIAALAQPNPPNPPNPPAPPGPPQVNPGDRDHKEKKVPVTFLGVETSDVPRVVSEQLGLAKGFGLVVDYVPAAAAGVQQNDILKMLNDQILTEPDQLSKLVRSLSEGSTVTLTVLRKGKEEKIGVKLAKKEVSERMDSGHGRHRFNFNFNGKDFGNCDLMTDFQDQMKDLQEQLGDTNGGMIHDAVKAAQAEAQRAQAQQQRDLAQQQRDLAQQRRDMAQQMRDRAHEVRDQVKRAAEEARRAAGNITVTKNGPRQRRVARRENRRQGSSDGERSKRPSAVQRSGRNERGFRQSSGRCPPTLRQIADERPPGGDFKTGAGEHGR